MTSCYTSPVIGSTLHLRRKKPQYTDFISDEWIVLTLKWNLTKSSVLFYMQQEKVALQPAETLKYHLTIL